VLHRRSMEYCQASLSFLDKLGNRIGWRDVGGMALSFETINRTNVFRIFSFFRTLFDLL
jgi:hypothetical protein